MINGKSLSLKNNSKQNSSINISVNLLSSWKNKNFYNIKLMHFSSSKLKSTGITTRKPKVYFKNMWNCSIYHTCTNSAYTNKKLRHQSTIKNVNIAKITNKQACIYILNLITKKYKYNELKKNR